MTASTLLSSLEPALSMSLPTRLELLQAPNPSGLAKAAWRCALGMVLCGVALTALIPLASASPVAGVPDDRSLGPVSGPPYAAQQAAQRAGRLADFDGGVWLFDTEQGRWSEALRNRALTEGDRVSTDRGARAELRVGSTELRMGPGAELEIVRLDDERMSFQLHRGSLALRVRSRDIAREVELLTVEARLQPARAGAYRVDREDDTTWATAVRGELLVRAPDQQLAVAAGQRVELAPQGRGQATLVTWSAAVQDRFADWVAADEARDDRSASLRYVSPEMTGVEELDRHGRWERHPEYGMVWSPLVVAAGWAPFRHGRWIWHARWGWTWVDSAPWGFAPFHYGRWVLWGHRWVWTPGVRVPRPVFAPALVTFTAPSVGISIVIGPQQPPVHWVPLGPREPYRPWVPSLPHAHVHVQPHPLPSPRHAQPSVPSQPVHPAPQVRPVHPVHPPSAQVGPPPERPPAPRPPQVMPGPSSAPPVYAGGRSRETEDVLTPAPQVRQPEPWRSARIQDPVMRPAPPPAAPRASTEPRPGRPDREDRERSERAGRGSAGDRADRGDPGARLEPGEGRGRSTTEHRLRDQRERAQAL